MSSTRVISGERAVRFVGICAGRCDVDVEVIEFQFRGVVLRDRYDFAVTYVGGYPFGEFLRITDDSDVG